MNPTIDLLMQHRSIRKFSDEALSTEVIETLIKAGQAAATSSFIQSCSVVNITDPDLRKAMAECAGGQAYVEQAPTFLVFCADMNRHKVACEVNDAPMMSGYTEQFLTASLDCALFSQNLVVAAESLGYGTVYIGGIRNQIAKVAELLNLPELVYPVFGLCIGKPAQDPEVKPRLPVELVLSENRYPDRADLSALEQYDQHVREYYQTRTGGNKEMSWTEQISGMLSKEARPHMMPFLQQRGFLNK